MIFQLNKSKPICPQIASQICVMIAIGSLKAEEKLPSVRTLAIQNGVNPNTVQKAFEQLQQMNLIYSKPCMGWYVCENIEVASKNLSELINNTVIHFFEQMQKLGCNITETKKIIREWKDE